MTDIRVEYIVFSVAEMNDPDACSGGKSPLEPLGVGGMGVIGFGGGCNRVGGKRSKNDDKSREQHRMLWYK